jgi:hypothetical protein
MTLTKETKRGIEALPEEAADMTKAHWRIVGVITRRLSEAAKTDGPLLTRFEMTVSQDSRAVEKEWFRAALLRVEDTVSAFDAFDDWYQSSELARVEPRIVEGLEKVAAR